jgi:DNA-binding CsgD family transcriptional regulator
LLPNFDKLSGLLKSLYDAAGDPRQWPEFLRLLARTTHGSGAAITLHNPRQMEHAVLLHSGYDAAAVSLYERHYASRDVWLQRVYPTSYSGWLGISEDVCPTGEFLRTEIYGDFFRQVDIAHAMWATINHPRDGRTNFLGIYRHRRQGQFSPRDLELVQFLMPHMRRAFRLHFQFAELKRKNADLQAAFDQIETGIVLLGAAGKVLVMNRAASQLLSENDGISLRGDTLHAQNVRESGQLQSMIAKAQATSTGKGLSPGGMTMISRKARPPLNVAVAPLRDAGLQDGFEPASAIVYIYDPVSRVRPAHEILCTAFRLTPAECRVALLLGDGKSTREISQVLGVTANTLKSQLASIYRKTGISRQSQLVRLLVRLPSATA